MGEEVIEARIRTRIHPDELEAKKGKIVTDGDYNLLVTGQAKIIGPDGQIAAVFLPGVLRADIDEAWPILHKIRMLTDNRGMASGTPREKRGDQKRTRTRNIYSATLGSVDPGPSSTMTLGRSDACKQTSWTAQHPDEWLALHPLLRSIANAYELHVPDRFKVQQHWAAATDSAWVVPGTPFTTVTVNNSYSTGVHQDKGDLKEGFSTLTVARAGDWTGGILVLAELRVGVRMGHGDLLLFNPHLWHGNTAMVCSHQEGAMARPCPEGCERVSLVAYYRTKVRECGCPEDELAKAIQQLG